MSSKRRWFVQNRKIDSFPKEKIFPFGNNCPKGFVVWSDYVFQIKFCIKICKKPPSWFFISYNCFILVLISSEDIIFLNFLELLHSTLLQKRFLSQFSFFNNGFTETCLPPLMQQQPKSAKYDEFFCWC